MLRLDKEKRKLTSLEKLENAMVEEFILANEMATTRVLYLYFHLKDNSSIHDHIS